MRPFLARRTALLAGAAALLAGCGEDTWLGENKGPPLPGKRGECIVPVAGFAQALDDFALVAD